MTISCRLCGQEIRSGLPTEQAQKHLLEVMTSHLGVAHKDQAVDFAITIDLTLKLIAPYLLISRYVRIPTDETEFRKNFEEGHETLLELFAVPKVCG